MNHKPLIFTMTLTLYCYLTMTIWSFIFIKNKKQCIYIGPCKRTSQFPSAICMYDCAFQFIRYIPACTSSDYHITRKQKSSYITLNFYCFIPNWLIKLIFSSITWVIDTKSIVSILLPWGKKCKILPPL